MYEKIRYRIKALESQIKNFNDILESGDYLASKKSWYVYKIEVLEYALFELKELIGDED